MFNFGAFLKNGFLNAAGWHEKGVLTEDDLAEIQAAIDAKNAEEINDDDYTTA